MDNLWNNDGGETSNGGQSIAEMIADTANTFIGTELLPGFVYLQNNDLWYNATTGEQL